MSNEVVSRRRPKLKMKVSLEKVRSGRCCSGKSDEETEVIEISSLFPTEVKDGSDDVFVSSTLRDNSGTPSGKTRSWQQKEMTSAEASESEPVPRQARLPQLMARCGELFRNLLGVKTGG